MTSSDDSEGFPTDYEIAQSAEMEPIEDVLDPWGIDADDFEAHGDYKAKLTHDTVERLRDNASEKEGNLVLVTGMTPTPMGEGKTVTTVGLGQTLNHVGEDAMIAIREPSLGPVFGVKGGAAGGGYSQVLPMEDINLHFTGDIHALTAAHNLIAAMLDAAAYHGTADIDITADVPLAATAVHVVSRSGTTAETLATFLVVREAMAAAGVDWTERTVVTTGEAGPLRALVEAHDLPSTTVPAGVPGRFSALSAVGLVPAAIRGHDLEALLAGASEGRAALADSLFDSPAYAYGATAYALDQDGAGTNVMMPYAEGLEPFAEWFAQLWAESLGKDGRGQTPVRALGATDQHSQLQLYRAGPRDKLVTLVRPTERADRPIPGTDVADLAYLGGHGLGDLLDAEFEATEASLAAAGRPNVRLEIDRLDAHGLGRLLFDVEAACILAGELYDVDTFTQPAVEWGKRAARGLLGGGDFPEAEAVADKTTLEIP